MGYCQLSINEGETTHRSPIIYFIDTKKIYDSTSIFNKNKSTRDKL